VKIEDLKPGMYVVGADVDNPKADRRKSRNLSAAPKWMKGLRVVVSEDWELKGLFTVAQIGVFNGVQGRRGGRMNHPGFEALIAALEPVEWTTGEWVQVHINCPNRVLVRLLDGGKITRQDVLNARKT
jgi:hypothetical protein